MVNCCILGCKSRTERKIDNITFHSFPKDLALKKVWVAATGRQNWNPSKYTRVCSRHFVDQCFRKTEKLTILRPGSVPKLFVHESIAVLDQCIPSTSKMPEMESTTESIPVLDESIPSTCAMPQMESTASLESGQIPIEYTPRKKRLFQKLQQKTILADKRKKKLAVLRAKNWRLTKKNAKLSDVIAELQSRFLINQESADMLSAIDPVNKDILKRVLGSSEKKYSPELRQFALTLHFISPRAYTFVRKSFDTCLPHPRTLTRWYQSVDGEPGFSKESLDAIKMLSENKSQLFGALSFDEMAIRQCVEFDGKNYVGFVNCGNNIDSNVIPVAKEALVFMLTCVNGSWKIPVGYFLINGITSEQKAFLVKQALDLIEKSGVNVISLTFDGCPANFSMARVLGCRFDRDNIDPIFTHNGKRVTIFPDPSHMLKLVRNTLGDKKILTTDEKKVISWDYVQSLVELQEKEGFHLGNKVNKAHVFFKKQVMKVKLAAQTFSASVADAIEFCNQDLELKEFKHSEATVDFIRKINSLFDIMNSRNLKAFGYKKPLTESNFESHKTFMEETYEYLKSLKLDGTCILDSNRKTGFLGFLTCIKSLIFLFDQYVKINHCFDFLCSYKLSQDHLEYFFSAVRAKGGFNNNPSARQFQSAYKRLLVHGELKHLTITTGNCIPLSDISILTCTKPEIAINSTTDRNRLNSEEDVEIVTQESDNPVLTRDHDYLADPSKHTEFARQVIIYIAGFVARSVQNQLKCQECLSVLCRDGFRSLQSKKDKGGLLYPSKDVVTICEIAEKVYKANKLFNKKNPLHHLSQECLKKCINLNLFDTISQHFIEQSVVDNHYGLLIKSICTKYLKVRMHYITKKIISKDDKIRNVYTKFILFKGE